MGVLQEGHGDPPKAEQTYHRTGRRRGGPGLQRLAALGVDRPSFRAADRGDFARRRLLQSRQRLFYRVGDDDELRAELMLKQGGRLNDEGKYDAARLLSGMACALLRVRPRQ